MRKRLACIIFLLVNVLAVICAINQDGHYKDEFLITAFKVNDNIGEEASFNLYVVDSVHGNFIGFDAENSSSGNAEVEVNSKIDSLFGDVNSTQSLNADTIIFQIIAFGNRTGNYSLDLSFSPMKNVNNDIINTSYTIGNVRGNFSNSATSITENGSTYYITKGNPFPRTFDDRTQVSFKESLDQQITTGNVNSQKEIGFDWTVYTQNALNVEEVFAGWDVGQWFAEYKYSLKDPINSPRWIIRSAVSMAIDKTDYETSPQGDYKATVTITFSQN